MSPVLLKSEFVISRNKNKNFDLIYNLRFFFDYYRVFKGYFDQCDCKFDYL